MQLFCWEGVAQNFGDALNRILWPRLLPGFFDDDPAELFLGIGSVLDARHDAGMVKLVAGAGYGGYQPLPILDRNWVIHWVRGPRTARQLGLPEACGLGDPAMLVDAGADSDRRIVGFMPHFESAADGAWRQAAPAASVTLIDPRDDTAAILAAIGRCRVLLSEAMHGAIVADAMRVPWVALRPLMPIHRAKWHDWADALDMQVHFQALAASTLPERLRATPIVRFHRGRRLLESVSVRLAVIARSRFVDRAASALATAARAPAQLSPDAALDRCRARMMERIHALALHPRRTCAYHG